MSRAAQGDSLVKQHVVPNDGGLADDHAHAVIDEEAPPDGGAGVDLNAGQRARNV